MVRDNRETWLAVVGHGGGLDDAGIRALVAAATERNIERTLAVTSDVIEDTPTSRLALRCFNAFATEATRAWLAGESTREETEKLLVTAFRDLLLNTIPALEAGIAKVDRSVAGEGFSPAASVGLAQGCYDGLRLEVVLEDVVAHLTAPAGLLVAAERDRGVEHVVRVDPRPCRRAGAWPCGSPWRCRA